MSVFKFKHFDVLQSDSLQQVGTDAMVLGALIQADNPQRILEVGSGTGVISLMLAQTYKEAKITALDIDEGATQLGEINFQNSSFKNRLSVVHQNFLFFSKTYTYNLIVSNPPYFNTKMLSENVQRNLARHEGSMTVKDLIIHADSLLTEKGNLWLIVPNERTEEVLKIKEKLKLKLIKRIEIYGKPNKHVRDVLVFSKDMENQFVTETFVIRDESGKYTAEYKEKTKDFHYNEL